jgi:adenylate cyclase
MNWKKANQDSQEIFMPNRKRSAHLLHSAKAKTSFGLVKTVKKETGNGRLQQAEMLLDVSRRVAALESLDDILETIVEMVTRELNAERGSLFLNDGATGELYSRVAQGTFQREIRLLNTSGIAGHVFTTGKGVVTNNAHADPQFDPAIDEKTGYKTKSICCCPVKSVEGEIIGVAQCLNKNKGRFVQADLALLEAITSQTVAALQSRQFVERMKKSREQEMKFLDMVSDVTSELELGALLQRVMQEATRMLNADRSTLFLHDPKTGELFSRLIMGERVGEIRLPDHMGIAGTVFTTGKSVSIPYAYADLRFSPAFDKKTGYFTRSILCVPVVNKVGTVIGVTQVLNKGGGPFTQEDETRLKAFTAQVSIALENAKLFDDVQNMKNYNDAMLQSMSNGVITVDEHKKIVTCNRAALQITRRNIDEMVGQPADTFFTQTNAWVLDRLQTMEERQTPDITMDQEMVFDGETLSVNVNFLPLVNSEGSKLGSMIMIEDISTEKRIKSTMSRYMDPGLADNLLKGGEDILGGKNMPVTLLFSDVRSFTTISEELGPQATVDLLNEYFTIMVECITNEEGMLDKFIGDAVMAGFGVPLPHADDADRAVRAAITMNTELNAWNQKRLEKGHHPIQMGIGLNTDTVVVGNIGSPKRMDYTMIGDGVNLASRLESACKQYAAKILMSESTYKGLKGTYRIRDVDKVLVKGKTQTVRIFEVLDFHTEETFPNLMEAVGLFKCGREHYDEGNWEKAQQFFRNAFNLNPSDKLAETYVIRCEKLKADPPKDWNGIWVMTSK